MGAEVLHNAVLDGIGRDITSGAIAPGEVLTLDRIQRRFAVSRTVAREAMRMLEAMQLVTSRRRVGLLVRPTADWDVFDPRVIRWRLEGPGRRDQLRSLTELRAAVEPVAAAGAARHATADERTRALDLAGRMRALAEAGSQDELVAVDVELHTLLLRASRNDMFAALTHVVAEVLTGRLHHGLLPPTVRPEVLGLHEVLARAVHDADPRAAETAMTAIMAEVRAALDETPVAQP